MAGDFSRRVPLTDAHDEFDTLAENLNRMLERIERLMKGMREVADSVAHDLRTPLNRLRNRLEEVQRRIGPQSPHAGEIEAAIAETDHLIATFNALLLIAEADSGVARGAMTQIDLSAVVADVAELYAPLAEEKNIALERDARGRADVEGNRSLISQALANLIDNAIKYTPPGGRVDDLAPRETPCGVDLRWPTAARAFRARTAPACSSASCGWKRAAIRRAPGWASAWWRRSRACTRRG